MEKATDKQTALLKRLGAEFDYNMSKQEASKLIEEIIAQDKDKPSPFKKEIKQPQQEFIEKQATKYYNKPKENTSFYVSYAKDILVAMIEKASVNMSDADLMTMTGCAIASVKLAKQEFE